MTDSEKIDLILNNMQKMDERMDKMDERMDTIESQIKQTERVLKNEIRNSENLILDEVERVHKILEKHQKDDSKYIA